ncbi:hypothetical protein N7520_002165 [Penicillium odoratum]|uniref:uncharacterized protein n=1 Tax=Penicillium odoratum TaxID=1167516 RepID=UPI00254978F9|nr:uncharacterized protein N7520_002165 [Penicillium odoratum]KAJ5771636.1 hypothetical protein N7520_002165 [Penicillium odoratum]
MKPRNIADKDDLRIGVAAPFGWRYGPGDTIIGTVGRKSPIVSPSVTLKVWLTGLMKVKILREGTSQPDSDHEAYINNWNLLDSKEQVIFRGPLHHLYGLGDPLSWPFSVTIPTKPREFITQGHQPHESFVPFGQDHSACNILPGSLRTSTGNASKSEALIEYRVHARFYYEQEGTQTALYATMPITLKHHPGNFDILQGISKGGLSRPTYIRSQRLLPDMADKEPSLREKTSSFFGSSKAPVFWFEDSIESPPAIQLDDPMILPIILTISTLKGDGRTSKSIEDVPQRIQINYVKIPVKSSTIVIAAGSLSRSVHTDRHDFDVDFHFEDVFKQLENPLLLSSSSKANESVNLGTMFQLAMRRNGLYTNGKRCSWTATRDLFFRLLYFQYQTYASV